MLCFFHFIHPITKDVIPATSATRLRWFAHTDRRRPSHGYPSNHNLTSLLFPLHNSGPRPPTCTSSPNLPGAETDYANFHIPLTTYICILPLGTLAPRLFGDPELKALYTFQFWILFRVLVLKSWWGHGKCRIERPELSFTLGPTKYCQFWRWSWKSDAFWAKCWWSCCWFTLFVSYVRRFVKYTLFEKRYGHFEIYDKCFK